MVSAGAEGGGAAGANTGVTVSSSFFSSSAAPLLLEWLISDDVSLSFGDKTSGCSLSPSLVASSVVELRRCLSRVAIEEGRADDAAARPFRGAASLAAADGGANDGLEAALEDGAAGGLAVGRAAAEVEAAKLGLGFVVAAVVVEGLLEIGGVLVLEVDVLEIPLLPACLEGDLTGDRMPLNPGLAAGVGVADDVPTTLCLFTPLTPGLGLPATPLPTVLLLAFGLASSTTRFTPVGRRNMP